MIAVPFIYFGMFLLVHLRKNKWQFDIASLILAIYAFSGFCSIFVDVLDLRSPQTSKYAISFSATFAYCSLITLCVWPFAKYSNLLIQSIRPIKNSRILKLISVVFFAYFVLNLYMSFEAIQTALILDNMEQIRNAHYQGTTEESWVAKFPFVVRLPFTILGMAGGCSWVFFFFSFYCIVVQRMNSFYGLMYIFASFNGLIGSILMGGRSGFVYWAISFLACYLFFLPFINKKQKRIFQLLILIIGTLVFLYMSAMTFARFGEDMGSGELDGSESSLINYSGQAFINFCYFFDTFECPIPSLQILMPLTYKLLGSPIDGGVELQQIISFKSGKELGVFYTFIGQIATTSNNIVAILYCLVLSSASMVIGRKIWKKRNASISTCFFYLTYSSVIFLGLFGHYYAYVTKTASIIMISILLFLLRNKKTSQQYKTESPDQSIK